MVPLNFQLPHLHLSLITTPNKHYLNFESVCIEAGGVWSELQESLTMLTRVSRNFIKSLHEHYILVWP